MTILFVVGAALTVLQLTGWHIVAGAPIQKFESYLEHLDSVLMQIIFYPLSLICAILLIVSLLSLPIGSALILFVVIPYFLKKQFASEDNMTGHRFSACLFPLLANLYMMVQPLIFVSCPRGTSIKPMGWTYLMFVVSVCLIALSLGEATKCIQKNKEKIPGRVGILLSLFPTFTWLLSYLLVINIKGLTLV